MKLSFDSRDPKADRFRPLQTVSTETDRRKPVAVHESIRPHLTPLSLVESARMGLWVIVVAILLFAVADLHLAPAVLPRSYALKFLQLAAALTALWGLRGCRTTAAARNLVLVTGGIMCALIAASGVVANDPSTAVVLCLMLTWGAAILIPWSTAAQLALAATAGAAILANALLTRGDLAVLGIYPALTTGLALGVSALLAHQLDKHRRAVASENAERIRAETALRRAHQTLERSVVERTAQLSATAEALRDSERRFRIASALTSDYAYAFRVEEDLSATVEWLTEASFQRITGYTPAEAEARGGGISLVHRDDHPVVRRRLENLLEGRADTSEFRIVTKSGQVRWIREHAEPEWDETQKRVVRIFGAAEDITERKQAEAALRVSEERFRVLAEQSSDVIFLTGADTTITYASPSLTRLMGYTPAEVIGQNAMVFIHPDDHGYSLERLAELLDRRDGPALEAHIRFRHKDGSWRWVEVVGSNLLETPGVRAIFITLRDITERKHAEGVLRERARMAGLGADVGVALTESQTLQEMSQRCAEAIVTHLDAAFARIWTFNPEGNVLELQASAGMYTHLDGPHSRVPVGQLKIGRIAAERAAHVTNNVCEDPRVSDREWARREGMVAFAGYPLVLEDRLVGVVALFARHPLTEFAVELLGSIANEIAVGIQRRQSEDALQRSEAHFRSLIENGLDIISVMDAKGVFRYASPSNLRVLGYDPETLVGRNAFELVHPDDRPRVQSVFASAVQRRGVTPLVEFRFRHQDGSWRFIEAIGNNLLDDAGVATIVVNSRDITDRKRAEEAAQRGERRFRALIERSQDLVSIIDRDGTYLYVNPAHEAVYGFKPDELVGRKAFDLLHPDDVRGLIPTLAEATEAGVTTATVEYRLRHKDGSWHAFEGIALNLLDDPDVAGILVTGRDITEHKRVEERTALLLEFAEDIRGTYDLDDLLGRVQRRTARVLPCDGVVTGYWQEDERVFRIIADYGLPAELRDAVRVLKFGPGEPFGDRLSNGETIVVNDFREATPALAGIVERLGITALIAAPLRIQGRHLGSLAAFRTAGGQPFDRNHADLCTGIAGQLVIAIEALKLQRQQQEEAIVSRALARVGQELIASFSGPTLLDRLSQVTNEVLGSDCSYTILREPDQHTYAVVATAGYNATDSVEVRALRLPAEAMTSLLSALEQMEVLQLDMTTPPTAWAAIPTRYGVSMALYTPVRRGQQIIGVHAAGWCGRQQRFSEVQERIARGIGQLASVALENARLVEELERANRLKSDFVATMSHELRTPLNIIMGYNELLLNGEFGVLVPQQEDTLQRTQKSAEELLGLINATLDISRLEAGRVALQMTEVSVQDLMNELARESVVIQTRAGLRWVWNVAPDIALVHTDAGKLKVVLNNLLRNAAKFTEKGTITVAAVARDGGVALSVSDTGIGIDPEALPIIFEPFRQADSSSTRRYGGVGLGLYIVRRLLDLLGGTISVESEPGRGSTFRVCLPAERTHEPDTLAPTPMRQQLPS